MIRHWLFTARVLVPAALVFVGSVIVSVGITTVLLKQSDVAPTGNVATIASSPGPSDVLAAEDAAVEGELRELREKVATLASSLQSTTRPYSDSTVDSSQLRPLHQELGSLRDKQDGMAREFKAVAADLAMLRSDLIAARASAESSRQINDGLVAQKLADATARLGALEKRVEALSVAPSGLNAQVATPKRLPEGKPASPAGKDEKENWTKLLDALSQGRALSKPQVRELMGTPDRIGIGHWTYDTKSGEGTVWFTGAAETVDSVDPPG